MQNAAQDVKAVLIDLDGVVYQADEAVPGAKRAIASLRKSGIPYFFLTNTTSKPRRALKDKLKKMGIETEISRILTPPVAASNWLCTSAPGPVSVFVPDITMEEFKSAGVEVAPDDEREISAVVIGDLGYEWTFEKLNSAFRQLMQEPQPALIALGMTRYWRTASGLTLDVGPFVKALEYASGVEATVLGKPSPAFFAAALSLLDANAEQTLMIGDDLVGDIGGAQKSGIRGVLVRTGKFQPSDLTAEISPEFVLDSIADLPELLQVK